AGFSVWFDRENLEAGDKWRSTIGAAIRQSRFFFAMLSKQSINKKSYVRREIIEATNVQDERIGRSFLVPIKIDDCELDEIPQLKEFHIVSLLEDWQSGYQKLVRILISDQQRNFVNREIIGFDLGHGETSLSKTTVLTEAEPTVLEILKGRVSIISAIGVSKEKGIVIGDECYSTSGLDQAFILFKSYEFDKPYVTDPTRLFIQESLRRLEQTGTIKNDESTYYHVGCPSGWSIEERRAYEQLLKSAGMKNVRLVSESRAAFIHARECGRVKGTDYDLHAFVLLIDIGSSTTDITVVRNLEERPIDFGHNKLGCGLIDHLVFQKSLKDLTVEDRAIAEAFFSAQPATRAKCLLECRYAKENYFSKPEDYWINQPCERSFRLKDRVFWVVELYKQDMNKLLCTPIEALAGLSWIEAFRDLLDSTKAYLDYAVPNVIVFTGGGAQMPHVREICKTVFPEAEVVLGFEPSLSIAKGLALAGKLDYKIHAFKAEVNDFVESTVLLQEIKTSLPKLLSSVSSLFAEQFMHIVGSQLWEWRNGSFDTLQELSRHIEADTQEHLKSDTISALLQKGTLEWLDKLSPIIENLTADICTKYGMERGVVSLNAIDNKVDRIPIKLGQTDYLEERYNNFASLVEMTAVVSGIGTVLAAMILVVPGVGIGLVHVFNWLKIGDKFERGMEKMRERIPTPVRKLILSKQRLDTYLNEERASIEKKIKEELQADVMSPEKLDVMVSPVKDMLYRAAEKASLLIR
ncbi:MAG: TIR domain-containing protein, partial [Nitrososphaera sp.]|nr:TIR domain-containing protein [Nitrososphaera sp.]